MLFHRKIGHELSEDAKFTKPKHRMIAEVFAKRMDDVISISYQKSYSDPAGINFDMNNLNIVESDAMGATLTNYLPYIINRRNAVTAADFKDQFGNCCSSCEDYNSEISVNVRQVSIESRRNSFESQVSQVSFKVSETNIKATLNQQKHKQMTKKQRNYMSSKRTTRRGSSSSVESQRITNQMKQLKYNYPGFQVSANTVDRQIERRSACTTADINVMNQLRNQLKQIPLTSDEDQRNDESQIMQITNEPSNMLVPFQGHPHQIADSADSLETSNDKQKMDAIEDIIKEALRNSSEQQIEAFKRIVNGQKENERSSRNKITKSDRNQLYAPYNVYPQQIDDEHIPKIRNGDELATSVSSSMDIDVLTHLDGGRSSFSDQSMNRIKTQSQNSKHSCDVGIQANDFDITSHGHLHSRGDCDKDHLPEKAQLNYQQDDEYTETHQLLPTRKRDAPSIVRRENLGSKHLSKSQRNELVNKLLLP